MLKLLFLEIVFEKKKGIGREGWRERKERKRRRGKKKGCSRVVFLILLSTKLHFIFSLFLNFLTCKTYKHLPNKK
jgi:hypothetical protein